MCFCPCEGGGPLLFICPPRQSFKPSKNSNQASLLIFHHLAVQQLQILAQPKAVYHLKYLKTEELSVATEKTILKEMISPRSLLRLTVNRNWCLAKRTHKARPLLSSLVIGFLALQSHLRGMRRSHEIGHCLIQRKIFPFQTLSACCSVY